jgi:uncharacterized membrane protein
MTPARGGGPGTGHPSAWRAGAPARRERGASTLLPAPRRLRYNPAMLRHLRHRPSLLSGLCVALLALAVAALAGLGLVHTLLAGWDCGVVAYSTTFLVVIRHATPERLRRVSAQLDEGSWAILGITVAASLASLGAIVAELARAHGTPHAAWSEALAGATVLLSWFFIHTVFATHYAHEFWRDGAGLAFPGNPAPTYPEFLYFSFCIAVASQVSDVSTQNAAMRRLVLAHSVVAYLFNTAVIALGVNIAASLAG